MKNLVILVILGAVAVAAYVYGWPVLQEKMAGDDTAYRVEQWLEHQKAGDEQTALCLWAEGENILPQEVMAARSADYDEFRRNHGFYDGVSSYEVVSVNPPEATVKINGQTLNLVVEPGEMIRTR